MRVFASILFLPISLLSLLGLPAMATIAGCGESRPAVQPTSAALARPAPPAPAVARAPAQKPPPLPETQPLQQPISRALTTEQATNSEEPAGSSAATHSLSRRVRVPAEADAESLAKTAAAAGFRRVEGEHLLLVTDRPADPEIDALTRAFDLAYPQWCGYFTRPEQLKKPWRMTAFLMGDRARFKAAGLLPAALPGFDHGYCAGMQLWLDEQPNAYYRRHLLLHEGTHGFMHTVLGGVGPVCYAEGLAELLATHRWVDGQLTLNWFPRRREEVPQLGRIKLVRDAAAAGRLRTIGDVLATDPARRFTNETYAWCWALAALLENDARYTERFHQSQADVRHADFNDRFRRRFAAGWRELADQWEVFATGLVHGYDFQRAAIEFAPGRALPTEGATVELRADRGWQSTRLTLTRGQRYRLRASGRYQVADEPRIWWCEPGGVTIRYIDGQPLGILLGAVRPDRLNPSESASPLVRPQVIGLSAIAEPEQTGTLYLRINESAAELADNAGTLRVQVSVVPDSAP